MTPATVRVVVFRFALVPVPLYAVAGSSRRYTRLEQEYEAGLDGQRGWQRSGSEESEDWRKRSSKEQRPSTTVHVRVGGWVRWLASRCPIPLCFEAHGQAAAVHEAAHDWLAY